MNEDVLKQELEIKVREWKTDFDKAAQIEYEHGKAKELADNSASNIMSLMAKLSIVLYKTPYGSVSMRDGVLSLSNHEARAVLPSKRKKKGGIENVLEA